MKLARLTATSAHHLDLEEFSARMAPVSFPPHVRRTCMTIMYAVQVFIADIALYDV
jgi:hypothetical protein